MEGETIAKALVFRQKLPQNSPLNSEQTIKALAISELYPMHITQDKIASLEKNLYLQNKSRRYRSFQDNLLIINGN